MRTFLTVLGVMTVIAVACLPAVADDDDAKRPTISVGGEARNADELADLKEKLDEELEAADKIADEQARAAAREPLVALIDALGNAVALMRKVEGAPARAQKLSAELAKEKQQLSALQAQAAKPVEFQAAEVDEALINKLDAANTKAATEESTATDAMAKADEALDKVKSDFEALAQKKERLKTDQQRLGEQLKGIAEGEIQRRRNLEHRIEANQVRQGIIDLEQAHHTALRELATLERDLAQVRAQAARAKKERAEAELAAARKIYESKLADQAARKAKEAEEKLRKAIDASVAKKAILRLEALIARMEGEEREEHALESELSSTRVDLENFLKLLEARFESVRLLYPEDAELEPWQQEGMAEQLRQLEEDEAELERVKQARNPDLNATLAAAVTKRGRLDIFDNALTNARDKIEGADDATSRAAAIQRELKSSRDENYSLWLQARLDFLEGQSDDSLGKDALAMLRKDWRENTVELERIIKERLDDLEKVQSHAKALRETYASLEQSLNDRRAYLETLTFWLRGTPLFASEHLQGAREELGQIVDRLKGMPGHIESVTDEIASGGESDHRRVVALGMFVLLASFAGLVISRRIRRSPLIQKPIAQLDGGERLLRGLGFIVRKLFLPAALLGAAIYARNVVLDGDVLGTVFVGVALVWFGWRLARGTNAGLFQVDENGVCCAGCDAATAKRARRCVMLVLLLSAVCAALALVLHDAGLERLARFVRFVWGVVAVLIAFWLVWRRDVLTALVPSLGGGLAGRTLTAMLQLIWPLAALFLAGVLVMSALGYSTAARFYGTRALLCAAALVVIGVLHSALDAMFARRLKGDDEEPVGAYDATRERRRLTARFLSSLNTLVTIAVIVFAISLIFDLTWQNWVDFGNFGLFAGLTVGKLAQGILIFGLSVGCARFLRDLMRIVLRSRSGLQKGSRYAVRTLMFYTIVTLGTLAALSALGVELSQLGWFLTAAGVGIGFGLQEIISNFISGLILFMERPVQVGDVVTVGDVQGDVQQINIRSTVVRTRDGVSIIVPNKSLITSEVINWSHGEQRTRLTLNFGAAYGSDVQKVKALLVQAAEEDERVMKYPKPEVEFAAFGESELQFVLYVWLPTPEITARRRVRSNVNSRVDELFAENGVEIPFPQRDLHLRSSDIGSLQEEPGKEPDDEVPSSF